MKNNLVKILATLGLIVAIALILRGVFDIGKIGFKNFSSKLPVLKCEIFDPNAKNTIEFYDLEQIKNDDPTQDMSKEERKELMSRENLYEVLFSESERDNEYKINWEIHQDGIRKSYNVDIKKDTGLLEMWFPTHFPVKDVSNSQVFIQAYVDAKIFKGECIKVERKNL
tara:strand:+ start:85 stop:591 length:507 start_codon:yes stop_codon:yes gene_type:complete